MYTGKKQVKPPLSAHFGLHSLKTSHAYCIQYLTKLETIELPLSKKISDGRYSLQVHVYKVFHTCRQKIKKKPATKVPQTLPPIPVKRKGSARINISCHLLQLL